MKTEATERVFSISFWRMGLASWQYAMSVGVAAQ